MDFARKQLEKYGWTDGKGLGKNENGISEALKPKLKRSVAGIGHYLASDFTEHWWTNLYDKAASNVQVEEKNGKTKKIKIKDDQFKITNSTYHLNKKTDPNQEEYSDFFVKTAVLTGGGVKTERVRESDSESGEEKGRKDVFRMTDEELFAACEGRTAHKGARHGLKFTGKLARIEQQEKMLLKEPKYTGYLHSKNIKNDLKVVEDINLNSDTEMSTKKKKKKKRRRCYSNENVDLLAEHSEPVPEEKDQNENGDDLAGNDDVNNCKKIREKSQKSQETELINEEFLTNMRTKSKKKKKSKELDDMAMEVVDTAMDMDCTEKEKKRKKKKHKN